MRELWKHYANDQHEHVHGLNPLRLLRSVPRCIYIPWVLPLILAAKPFGTHHFRPGIDTGGIACPVYLRVL